MGNSIRLKQLKKYLDSSSEKEPGVERIQSYRSESHTLTDPSHVHTDQNHTHSQVRPHAHTGQTLTLT